jgi:AcrR family transcriptional regulator
MENPSQDTRTALLHAALVCFAEKGFDGTSMRMIADRAKRPLSLLAHHFGNKEGLYIEVFKLILSTSFTKRVEALGAEGRIHPRDRAEAIRLLREQIHLMYSEVTPEAGQQDLLRESGSRLWLQEMRSPRADLIPVIKLYITPIAEFWKNCIQALRPELGEAEVVALGISILGMVAGHGLLYGVNQIIWGENHPIKNPFQASELLVDLCLNGVMGNRSNSSFDRG